jgi:hypothetical protein
MNTLRDSVSCDYISGHAMRLLVSKLNSRIRADAFRSAHARVCMPVYTSIRAVEFLVSVTHISMRRD